MTSVLDKNKVQSGGTCVALEQESSWFESQLGFRVFAHSFFALRVFYSYKAFHVQLKKLHLRLTVGSKLHVGVCDCIAIDCQPVRCVISLHPVTLSWMKQYQRRLQLLVTVSAVLLPHEHMKRIQIKVLMYGFHHFLFSLCSGQCVFVGSSHLIVTKNIYKGQPMLRYVIPDHPYSREIPHNKSCVDRGCNLQAHKLMQHEVLSGFGLQEVRQHLKGQQSRQQATDFRGSY